MNKLSTRSSWFKLNYFKLKHIRKNIKNYKRFFVWKKKFQFISRLRWFFNNTQVVEKYFIHTYHLKESNFLKKVKFGCRRKLRNKIYNFLYGLNLRLDLLLTNFHFINDFKQSKVLIKNRCIKVNNIILNTNNYSIKTGDKISVCFKKIYNLEKLEECKKLISKHSFKFIRKRRKIRYRLKRQFRYKFLWRHTIVNFLEINYRIFTVIILRPMYINEIRKKFFFKIARIKLLRKFWAFS